VSKLTLTEWRVKKFISNVREEYDQDSIIKEAVSWRHATLLDEGPFVQIGMRFLLEPAIFIDSYSPKPVYYSPELMGAGRAIAFGEEKYLVETFQKNIQNIFEKQSFSFEAISRAMGEVGSDFEPNAVFIPLDFFVMLHTSEEAKGHISYEKRDCYLLLGPRKLRLFWSSNYVPFDSLIFVSKRLGEWIVKPDPVSKHWVTIDIEPADEKVDVAMKTVAYYAILDPKAGLILKVPPPKW